MGLFKFTPSKLAWDVENMPDFYSILSSIVHIPTYFLTYAMLDKGSVNPKHSLFTQHLMVIEDKIYRCKGRNMRLKSIVLVLVVFTLTTLILPLNSTTAQDDAGLTIESSDVEVMSGDQAYLSYLAAPTEGGPYPAIVLIHSFNGLEEGYRTMTDQFAAEGFVVLAVGWQTFERSPSDDLMSQLMDDSITFLTDREDVDPERLGLTGFCAGGRYTMLFLPQIEAFSAGVAWYGFPNNGDPAPAAFVDDLDAPMLIIHGTEDDPSPIADIYQYATQLDDAGAYFELKVYQGEPHGFMLSGGQLRDDDVAQNAFDEMATFFQRQLAEEED